MNRLRLLLLGPPRIERDGTAVDVDTRKAIALVAYLAVTRQRHSRDTLAALLWPEYDNAHARAALRRTLSVLNKALDGETLEVDRETIGLRAGADLWVDLDAFRGRVEQCQAGRASPAPECAVCLAPLAEAAALYRGDFLAGFSLRDSADFDDWQFFQAEGLRRELAEVLERLAVCYGLQGEFALAIDYARRWLALDPLHEPAHQHLMLLYARAGRRSAALHQYEECARILDRELGVPPLAETTRLYEAIKANQVPAHHPLAAPHPQEEAVGLAQPAREAPALGRYPLVGRAVEWGAVQAAYGAIGPDGRLVVLEGEAGIGKTRLAAEFVAAAKAGGAATLVAHCYQGESNLPYGPFIEALRAALARPGYPEWPARVPAPWLSEAARLLPELATAAPNLPPAPPLDSPGAQSRFFEGIRRGLLSILDGPPPGVFLIDDLHWADPATLDLLAYLVRRLRGHPVCLLATWRGEDVPPGSSLRLLLAEAQRAGLAVAVPLGRLDEAAVRELVRSASADDAANGLGKRLYQESEGLPFFVVEYLTAVAASGGERARTGEAWALPGGVRDLLLSRLAAVGDTGRRLLAAASAIGRSFDLDLVAAASGLGEEETVAALEELIARGIVQEMRRNEGPLYDFRHEKLRDLVYEEMSLARRRLVHRRVADALVRRTQNRGAGPRASQIASHYRLAGQAGAAAEYYRLAGENARRLYANAEALAHFRAALELGHPDVAALHEAIGDLHTLAGEYGAALTSYKQAAAARREAIARPEDVAGPQARLEHKLGNVYHRLGEWEQAERHYQAALAALGELAAPGELARIETDWSLSAYRQGQSVRAAELAQRARERAEAAGDRRAVAQAHNVLGILASSQQDLAQARYHLERSLALAEELEDPGARAAALNNLALAYRAGGELGRALDLAQAALALCTALGDRHREAAMHNNLADLLHEAGQTAAARAHVSQSVTILGEIGEQAGAWQPGIWKLVEW